MEEIKTKYLNKLLKIVSKEGRVLIGKLKCIDKQGNLYFIDCVEVFALDSPQYCFFNLYENHPEHTFYFKTEKNNYQIYTNMVAPMKEIKQLIMLKE